MKGGVVNALIFKALGVIGIAIIAGMFLVPTMGPQKTASLYGTVSVVGGTSTGITFASLPDFFTSVAKGYDLAKGGSGDASGEAPQVDKKSSAKSGG